MIRVQLWKEDTQIGEDRKILCNPDPVCPHHSLVDAYVDELITGVHRGDHGRGQFRIEADFISAVGLFMGSYYRCDFVFPRAQHRTNQHA